MHFIDRLRASSLTGWLFKATGQKNTPNTPVGPEQTSPPPEQAPQTEKIEVLLESVNSASQHVRNFYITFLIAGFYIAVIIWSTTDVMLLKESPIKLPILDVELPITGFYQFAPFFYLLLHFNLLLQLCLLADKVHRFDKAVRSLPASPPPRKFATTITHDYSLLLLPIP